MTPSGTPAGGWWSRRAWPGRSAPCSSCATGDRLAALAPAQDFKRRDDGDGGPNTGGMGAYSPVPVVDDRLVDRLVEEAVAPLVAALRARGIDYRGVLYAGLMLTPDGPKVLEFNVRFGDPETQVVLPRLEGDLAGLLAEVAAGRLDPAPVHRRRRGVRGAWPPRAIRSRPAPATPSPASTAAGRVDGVTVFHAGTAPAARRATGVVTAGGRVLGVTALGPTLGEARSRAYRGVAAISWPGAHARTDIARRGVGPPALRRRRPRGRDAPGGAR